MTLTIRGTVEDIQDTKTYPKKDKTGMVDITKLRISGNYYTSFDSSQLKDIVVDSDVDVAYTQKENEFEGKKYINRNITLIELHKEGEGDIDVPEQPSQKTKGENIVNVGDKSFRVTIEEV